MAIRRASIIGGIGSPSSGGTTSVRARRQASGAYWPSAVARSADDRAGDRVSVIDFGAAADGTTDDSTAFNDAINAAITLGNGATVWIPGGTYAIGTGIIFPSTSVAVTLEGDIEATVLKRTGSFSTTGMIDIQQCSNITLRNFTIEGQVTSSTGVLYSSFGGDPMNSALVANTSIWIHSPTSRICLQGLKIQHTGGYAVLIDCAGGTAQDIRILDCLFQNNRPHLFGTSALDLNYGSWTGGVFVSGDGTTFGAGKILNGFLVSGCTFRRMTGNCLWSHLYTALNDLHCNFRWQQNHFEDIGLDGMGVNGVTGGVVDGNTVRRNGYITSDDTSPSTPKYLANAYSVGLDTAGLTKGVAYTNNSFVSPNGAAMDLDGYALGVVSGNVARVPVSGEPEYTTDQIASTGPGGTGNVSYGAQTSNTNNHPVAGTGVKITGNTFTNLSGGAIRLYAARGCVATDNVIVSPAAPAIQPIVLGNIGSGANQRAYNNIVSGNQIQYSPGIAAPCVYEDSSIAAFSASDVNWVNDNQIIGNGNAFEFEKDATTASVTVSVHSTQAHVTSASETVVQREGSGNNSLTRWYWNESGVKRLVMDLHHKLFNSGLSVVGGPLLNICDNGTSGTGSVSTGGRTTLAFDDCVATSRNIVDGFFAITDSTFTYPNDSAADLLPASYGLIRFNSSSHIFEQSVSVSGGHRVWAALTTAVGGSNTQVQYNNSGALAGSPNFIWDNAGQLLTVTAASSGAAGIACATGYIQSDAGFYATVGTATSYQAIQAPGGGLYGKSLRAVNYTQLGNSSGVPTVTSGDTFVAGAIYWDTGAAALKVYNGSTWANVGSGVTSLNSLSGALSIAGTTNQISVSASGSTVTLSTPQDINTNSNVNFATVTLPNNSSYNCKDTLGTAYSILLMGSDNNVYLDNPKTSQDIYIRPASGRFVFLGRNGVSTESICPNGDQKADLGTASFRWNNIVGTNYQVGSTTVINSSTDAFFNSVTLPNNHSFNGRDTGGTAYSLLLMGSDNNVYLDNPRTSQDVYIRPASGRFVFLGRGSSEAVCPNGNATASLGTSSFQWTDLYLNGVPKYINGVATAAMGVPAIYWNAYLATYTGNFTFGVSLPAGQYCAWGYIGLKVAGSGGSANISFVGSDGTAFFSNTTPTINLSGGLIANGGATCFYTSGGGITVNVNFFGASGSPQVQAAMAIARVA